MRKELYVSHLACTNICNMVTTLRVEASHPQHRHTMACMTLGGMTDLVSVR